MESVVEVREAALENYDDEESGETSATDGVRSIIHYLKRGNRDYEQDIDASTTSQTQASYTTTRYDLLHDPRQRRPLYFQKCPSPLYCNQIMSRHARLVGVFEIHFQDMP